MVGAALPLTAFITTPSEEALTSTSKVEPKSKFSTIYNLPSAPIVTSPSLTPLSSGHILLMVQMMGASEDATVRLDDLTLVEMVDEYYVNSTMVNF